MGVAEASCDFVSLSGVMRLPDLQIAAREGYLLKHTGVACPALVLTSTEVSHESATR
jgi:hypothetical protein